MPGPPARSRVAATIEGPLELERTVEEVVPDATRAGEADLRDRREGDRERRRIRQLFGEHEPCLCVPRALVDVAFLMRQPRELAEEVHLLAGLQAGFGKGEEQEVYRHGKALCHPAGTGEPAEGVGSDWAGRRGGDRVLEQNRRLLRVARIATVLGGGDAASVHALERVRRRQRDRVRGEVGRGLSSAASSRMRRRRVQRRRDAFVGAGCRDRQMAGALLEIDIQLGETLVKPAPSVQRHRFVAGGRQERMSESDPLSVELHHAPSLGELDVVDAAASESLEQCHRR